MSAPSFPLLFVNLNTGPVELFPSFCIVTTGFEASSFLIIKLGVFASNAVVATTFVVGATKSTFVVEFNCATVSVFTTKLSSASIVIPVVVPSIY